MPGWSPEIANEFIRLGLHQRRMFNQMQLQKLVYIAHGWCLAFSGHPLTGDRPEAWDFGPVYRRLADALSAFGIDAVAQEIRSDWSISDGFSHRSRERAQADLNEFEMDTITMVYEDYGALAASQLSALTQRAGSPWSQVYGNGSGKLRDIPHRLIRDQFAKYAEETGEG
jgi:uncharacterized phage-associated protein